MLSSNWKIKMNPLHRWQFCKFYCYSIVHALNFNFSSAKIWNYGFIVLLEDTSSRNKSLNSFWGLCLLPLADKMCESWFFICESHWRFLDPTIGEYSWRFSSTYAYKRTKISQFLTDLCIFNHASGTYTSH